MIRIKKAITVLSCALSLSAFAQQKPTDLDKSPMDMSYAPQNYPILKMNGKIADQPVARIIYGRPQKAGRTIFLILDETVEQTRRVLSFKYFQAAVFGAKPLHNMPTHQIVISEKADRGDEDRDCNFPTHAHYAPS